MASTDYLSSLQQRVEELMDQYVQEHNQIPQKIVLPRSSYIVLEDYCIAKEQELHVQLLLLRAQTRGVARQHTERKIRIARTRLQQLGQHGVKLFSCKYGQIPIEVQDAIEEITIG